MKVSSSLDLACGAYGAKSANTETQTLEPEMSILLKDDIVGLVAIGDPQQLPGVVANRKLESKGYSISLFERLLNAGSPHLLLATQYRMHPDISQWPANTYYDGQLEDGRNTIMSGRTPSWQIHGEELFSPYSFIAIHGLEEKNLRTKSYCNQAEANVVLSFLQRLLTTLIRTDHEGEVEVGCITGYTAQVRLVVKNLSRLPGSIPIETASKTEKVRIVVTSRCSIVIDVASVDAFQGQERDIIIFATTRANNGRQLGFLSEFNAILADCSVC
jgi:senataxin